MSNIKTFLMTHWRGILQVCVVLAAVTLLLGYCLGNVSHGVAASELANLKTYSSFHALLHNPLDAPYKVTAWALWHIPYHNAVGLRLPSVVFGVVTLALFSFIVRRWYGFRAALFGITLFATSSWFLHVSRFTSLEIEYLWGIATLIGLHLLLHAYHEHFMARIAWFAGMALLLFVPGFLWLVAFNVFIQREDLSDMWNDADSVDKIIFSCIAAISFALLALTFVFHPHLLMQWLGAPVHISDWQGIVKRLGNAFMYFIVRGPSEPSLWLGRLPVLDAFVAVMTAAGIAFYVKHLSAPRTQLLAGLFSISAILFALNPGFRFSALVPIVYLIAVAGIAYVLHQWLKIFPRNPLARSIGIGIVVLVAAMACFYNLRSYFVAWPQAPPTIQVMSRSIKDA
ncbi:MAG TPA: hypothetical protein VFL85_03420 [Candidatus Saccharimonadales bacterium]|nr:hypothetical protein [Candidatus Saccharimonadales bacterium]